MGEVTERQGLLEQLEQRAEVLRSTIKVDLDEFHLMIAKIHDDALWRDGPYRSWQDYLLKRWEVSRQTGWRWLDQGRKLLELGDGSADPPKDESAGQRVTPRDIGSAPSASKKRPNEPDDVVDPPETGQLSWAFAEPASKDQHAVVLRWVRNLEPGKIVTCLSPAEVRQGAARWRAAVELLEAGVPPPTPTEKRQQAREEKCPHPMHRRSKGQCLKCGEMVKR